MGAVTQHKAIISRFFDALNRGDVDTVVNTYAENGQVQTMGGTLISGTFSKEHITASVNGIFEVFPLGLKFSIDDMVAEGNKVAVEATSLGEHVSGKTYSNEYHFLFEFLDGKLIKLKEYMDTEVVTDVLCAGQQPPFAS
jgi:ketosteroid isomerase-like protein